MLSKRRRPHVAGLVGVLMGFAAAAQAQEDPLGLEEIVVTARKRAESLIDIPVAVSALSANDIEQKGIESLYDIAQFTPGLTYFDSIQNQLGTPVIRGISQTNLNSPDRNVAIFYGGVYLSSTSAANLEILDVARVEVVRGPQSALYGRNAFNGAINFVPAEPTESFFGKVEGTVGTDERYEGKITLSGPITERIGFRVAASVNQFDGTYTNTANRGDNIGGYETKNVSGMLTFQATDALNLKLFGYFTDDQRDPSALYVYSANTCGPVGPMGQVLSAVCGEYQFRDTLAQHPQASGLDRKVALGAFDVSYKTPEVGRIGALTLVGQTALYDSEFSNVSEYTANGVGYSLPGILLADITRLAADPGVIARATAARRSPSLQAYLEAPSQGLRNVPIFTGTSPQRNHTFSQELRIETDATKRLRATAGFFYFKNNYDNKGGLSFLNTDLRPGETFRDVFSLSFTFPNAIVSNAANVVDTSRLRRVDYQTAWFASAEFDVWDNLTVGGEARRDTEDRSQVNTLIGASSLQRRKFDYTTWRYHADLALSETQKTYVSAAKGIISGYFNPTFDALAQAAVPADLQKYDPAENRTYEIGWKAEWLNRRLSTDIALFHIDYTGIQINALAPPPLINLLIQNIGKARARGIEASANWAINSKFTLGGTYGYSPTEFAKNTIDNGMIRYCGGAANLSLGFCTLSTFRGQLQPDVGGMSMPRAPEMTASLYGSFTTPLTGDWSLGIRADASYISKAWGLTYNLATIPERTLINARISLRRGSNFEVALWGRNITDEDVVSAAIFQPRFDNGVTTPNISQGDGATFGLTASYKFGEAN